MTTTINFSKNESRSSSLTNTCKHWSKFFAMSKQYTRSCGIIGAKLLYWCVNILINMAIDQKEHWSLKTNNRFSCRKVILFHWFYFMTKKHDTTFSCFLNRIIKERFFIDSLDHKKTILNQKNKEKTLGHHHCLKIFFDQIFFL